jgi:hypothetical protein
MMFRLAGKAAANRCMEDHCFSRLSAVLAGRAQKTGASMRLLYPTLSLSPPLFLSVSSCLEYPYIQYIYICIYIYSLPLLCACFERAAAINRIKQRLEELRSQISLVLDLEHLLVPADMRLTMRDVSLLLGPCVRLQTALDTGVPKVLPVVSPPHACMSKSSHTHPRIPE